MIRHRDRPRHPQKFRGGSNSGGGTHALTQEQRDRPTTETETGTGTGTGTETGTGTGTETVWRVTERATSREKVSGMVQTMKREMSCQVMYRGAAVGSDVPAGS